MFDAAGVPQEMDVAAFVGSLKSQDKYAPAFRGSGASGSGAPVNGRAGGVGPVRSLADLPTVASKAAYAREFGKEAFQRLVDADIEAKRAARLQSTR